MKDKFTTHYEIACKSEEDFKMAIEAAKENERESTLQAVREKIEKKFIPLKEEGTEFTNVEQFNYGATVRNKALLDLLKSLDI